MHFLRDFPLASFNSFGVTAFARQFAVVSSEQVLMQWCADHGRETPPFLIGAGSNLLLTRDIDAPALQLAPRGTRVVFDEGNTVLVEAMAGEPWHPFVMWTLSQGLCGLENLSLIPGFVGAAPVQNIGAYGVEIAETVDTVMTINTQTGEPREFRNAECAFGYRDSVFKHLVSGERDRYAITRVRFRLSRRFTPRIDYGDVNLELQHASIASPTASDVSRAVIAIRSRKLPDPAVIGNAGSFFKNPVVATDAAAALKSRFPGMPQYPAADSQANRVKIAAGWLIEQAGWKGRRLSATSAAAVHDQHALVIVNHGSASGAEIWSLAQAIQADVQEKFGITLEPEPRVV